MVTKRIQLNNFDEAMRLFGSKDEHLRNLERDYGVQIFARQSPSRGDFVIAVRGSSGKVEKVVREIEEARRRGHFESRDAIIKRRTGDDAEDYYSNNDNNGGGYPATNGTDDYMRRRKDSPGGGFSYDMRRSQPHDDEGSGGRESFPGDDKTNPRRYGADVILISKQSGRPVLPRGRHQEEYVRYIENYDVVFAIGPAGTGKTFIAVALALRMLQTGMISRIVITRPIVEAGEKLGYLPGDFEEKVDPYLKPLYDAFYYLIGIDRFRALRDDGVIEIVPLAYMRGRTLEDSFVILDEAQNATSLQMFMLLTRLGAGSKVVVTGDITQIDLPPEKNSSGLIDAPHIFKDVEGVGVIEFTEKDVVRHPVVKKIIGAYQRWQHLKKEKI